LRSFAAAVVVTEVEMSHTGCAAGDGRLSFDMCMDDRRQEVNISTTRNHHDKQIQILLNIENPM
jgi:hypothetical protein